ncbi:TrkA family potassium uptake protein [Shewanella psychropiezotolerans]|uniref:TrkA family potassium uptake protein n=1 Tax=Shewanella psychropiezotolerans TaxID=2593655 RepID=A0ABX5WXV9_9GAMM|nr:MULTISPECIES: TrkA family potassium uptake protein [Shewanella]MPY24661.1 TrkA family potassium uptake protein [Shewanella sp. YLB-07]QDO83930.1 TrkA family potassium uptake protein [Shewanella psychropiezotolerans]
MAPENKYIVIIGLGRFGMALCHELSQEGAQVLAIDIDEKNVRKAAEFATEAIVADCSDEDTISELKLDDYDLAMVAIGEDVNASILTTLVLKEAGVKTVWVKAKDKFHAKILDKIGADKVIQPERDMGVRIAHHMLDQHIFEFIDLGCDIALAEVAVSDKYLGSKLMDHPCSKRSDINLLALKRGVEVDKYPSPEATFDKHDMLIVTGQKDKLIEVLRRL